MHFQIGAVHHPAGNDFGFDKGCTCRFCRFRPSFHYFSIAIKLWHYGYTGLLCTKAASGSQSRIRRLRISGAFRQCGLYGISGAYGSFRQRDHFHRGHFQSADEYHLLYRWRINDCPQRNKAKPALPADTGGDLFRHCTAPLFISHYPSRCGQRSLFNNRRYYRTSGDDDHRRIHRPAALPGYLE